MPEHRLVITPQEIIAVDVSCSTCHHAVHMPISVSESQPLAPLMALKTLQPCPWCGTSVSTELGAVLKQLLQELTALASDIAAPVRLVVQQ